MFSNMGVKSWTKKQYLYNFKLFIIASFLGLNC